MPIPIVDTFEVIDIQHQYRQRPVISFGRLKLNLRQFKKVTTVGHTRQYIGAGEAFQFHLGIFAFSNIHETDDMSDQIFAFTANG